ncbi:unnamed protein product [Trifolium pratense]|uniref:Uncharacterized protein n=1 Tax=Trifolium pratense TaxID=57577 RepID=A0ACB0LGU5_TRIPR|nr:unnamed protein product [Trifolium pratense]
MDFSQNTIAIVLLSTIILISLFHHSKSNKTKQPPMVPGAWPIIGHFPLLSKSQATHHLFGAMADKHGPLFTIKLGTATTLVINNWETAKDCYKTNDIAVSYRPNLVACKHMTYNYAMVGFAPYGPFWREMRKIVTLSFLSNHRIDLLTHVRVSEVQTSIRELFSSWKNKKDEKGYLLVEMKKWFHELAFNTVLRMVAGKRYFGESVMVKEEEANRCLNALRDYMRLIGVFPIADAVPFLRLFDFGGHEKNMKENFKELDGVVTEWLDEHKKKRVDDKSKKDQDFMDVMLSTIDGRNIHGFDSDTVIKATALALVLGATDTSSVTHIWALCLLLNNPHALEKVKEEIDLHIGKERLCITESDINKLVYLQAVVKETLRLYPASPLSGIREFREDCKIGGYHVKKGTRLFTNLWKIQTDPGVWSDPLEFKPERFLTTHKDVDVKGQHFEFLPFGSGRRICPGISFGLRSAYLTLANFFHSFEVLKTSSEPIDMTAVVETTNIKVTPLEVLIKPRLSPNYYENM